MSSIENSETDENIKQILTNLKQLREQVIDYERKVRKLKREYAEKMNRIPVTRRTKGRQKGEKGIVCKKLRYEVNQTKADGTKIVLKFKTLNDVAEHYDWSYSKVRHIYKNEHKLATSGKLTIKKIS